MTGAIGPEATATRDPNVAPLLNVLLYNALLQEFEVSVELIYEMMNFRFVPSEAFPYGCGEWIEECRGRAKMLLIIVNKMTSISVKLERLLAKSEANKSKSFRLPPLKVMSLDLEEEVELWRALKSSTAKLPYASKNFVLEK
ncbi:hypothetical protein L484_015192 [Morus notabilis]|uniref:Uncharacterized protein n=1 Tax=Morus notabilis TaxID=981085 RepID=W9SDM8_9ROSA|nr:hypothetical protein L484_015192 [Morus notabilis]